MRTFSDNSLADITFVLALLGFAFLHGMHQVQGCTKEDIHISQEQHEKLKSGVPTFRVYIGNDCNTSMSQIHLTCGRFSSQLSIDPRLFRRVAENDCLVYDGMPYPAGDMMSFIYAAYTQYPLAVASFQ